MHKILWRQRIIRPLLFSSILLLGSCAGSEVRTLSTQLIGKSWDQVLECVGPPNKSVEIDKTTTVVEWDYNADRVNGNISMMAIAAAFTPLVSVPASLVTGNAISISGSGDCRAIGTVTQNHLTALKFGGNNRTVFSGRNGVCEPILRGCESR